MVYDVESRLPYIKPENMNEEQRKFYDFHLEAMKPMPYAWITEQGELNGPSNLMLYEPEIGNMLFPLNRAIIGKSIKTLGGAVHEVAILATVAAANAQYGMYAHTKLAQKFGLADEKITAILAGRPHPDFTRQEAAAYDLAIALGKPGPIAGAVYDNCIAALGQNGVNILTFVIGMFKMIGTILNVFNEPVPEYRK
jgi:4-carboxymuconolactone decarboxylase